MELGQTQSPTDLIPGSVSDVRATAEAWKARSAAATQVHDDLARLDDDGTWKGDAYDAYLERFDRQLLHWKDAGEGLRAGANALFTWADALEWAQEEADRAITLWNEAEQQAAAALATHRASMRELRVGQGLRHPEVDVPFVDPSGAAHDEAREVLFNARMTLEVFARDCATRLDEAAAAARMPLTDQHRYFDGLYRNADGTYTAIEVKSGGGTQNAAQRGFDSTLSVERPATAMLNGEKIQIVRVILKEVP